MNYKTIVHVPIGNIRLLLKSKADQDKKKKSDGIAIKSIRYLSYQLSNWTIMFNYTISFIYINQVWEWRVQQWVEICPKFSFTWYKSTHVFFLYNFYSFLVNLVFFNYYIYMYDLMIYKAFDFFYIK
jgi:hypothetical protein